jgi:hypothetical protein
MTQQFTIDEIAAAILSAVREWGGVGVTFAQLERTIPGFCDNGTLYDPDDGHIIIWEGMSFEAIKAIKSLLERGAIHFRRSTYEAHQLDGRAPKLRIARERKPPPPNVFCWRPTAICLGPGPGERRIEEQKR